MWVAGEWKEYKILDASDGEKLEDWAGYILIRPDPVVIFSTAKKDERWLSPNAHYHRSSSGGGRWEIFDLPENWKLNYELCGKFPEDDAISRKLPKKNAILRQFPKDYDLLKNKAGRLYPAKPTSLTKLSKEKGKAKKSDTKKNLRLSFNLKPFSFKHTGVFPEQAVNWEFIYNKITERNKKNYKKNINNKVRVLNLFSYTGGATLASAKADAEVVHVDASRGMVNWAKENARSSFLSDAPIRWLVDDARKFVAREIRRGSRYDAIIMDPPSYGRGPKGEVWKLEDDIFSFLKLCVPLLSEDPLFVIVNSYTTGLSSGVLKVMLELSFNGGKATASELGLPIHASSLILPEGATGRYVFDK